MAAEAELTKEAREAMADERSAAQYALNGTLPQQCSWDRPVQVRVRRACHRAAACSSVQLEMCAFTAAVRQRQPWGGVGGMGLRLQGVWPLVCGTGCAVQEGGQAGCEEGALGGHAAAAKERVKRTLCRRAAVPRIRSQLAHRLWPSSCLAPHSTAQAAACSL